jgi:hypothetical protein
MTARRRSFLLVACLLAFAVLVVPSVALANAGVHGNYNMNTDQCAGCHRAHTAPSSVTWFAADGSEHSALLLGDYTQLYQFCYTCHGETALGAATNVEEGVLETRASGSSYGTPGMALLSGPFGKPSVDASGNGITTDWLDRKVTSTHDYFGASWGAYGGGVLGFKAADDANLTYTGSSVPSVGVGSALIKMDCGSCHDVHGSSNYRILKDEVYGTPVGGYGAGPTYNPDPYVTSTEEGYPAGGFRLQTAYPLYKPNYTTPNYAKGPGANDTAKALKGMSGWCVGCHTFYMGAPAGSLSASQTYEVGDVFGEVARHRHPVNVALSTFKGPRGVVADSGLPLAHDPDGTTVPSNSDWVDCLTCHNAHGTTAVMTGFANVFDPTHMEADTGRGGVSPTDDSALLRVNNRGVCERCHNK